MSTRQTSSLRVTTCWHSGRFETETDGILRTGNKDPDVTRGLPGAASTLLCFRWWSIRRRCMLPCTRCNAQCPVDGESYLLGEDFSFQGSGETNCTRNCRVDIHFSLFPSYTPSTGMKLQLPSALP